MRKTHKLLAVMMWLGSTQASADAPRTLANGAPACGNTMGKSSKPRGPCRVSVLDQAIIDLADAQADLVEAKAFEVARINEYITTPRRLANGAPACGNVMSKDAPDCNAELADLQDARRVFYMKMAIEELATARLRVHEATQRVANKRQARETRPQDLALTVPPDVRPPS